MEAPRRRPPPTAAAVGWRRALRAPDWRSRSSRSWPSRAVAAPSEDQAEAAVALAFIWSSRRTYHGLPPSRSEASEPGARWHPVPLRGMVVRMTSVRSEVPLGEAWTLDELVALSRREAKLIFPDRARERVAAARAVIDRLADAGDEAPNVYGVNTGFGALAETRIRADQIRTLQHNLVRSHACGVGALLPHDAVRGMIALRAQTVAMGCSGARPEVVDLLVAMLDRGVIPHIPCQGSVGASGDLAPLAHLALVLIGEGTADLDGAAMPGGEALAKVGLAPLTLEAKEGLPLVFRGAGHGVDRRLALHALRRPRQPRGADPRARGQIGRAHV